MALDNMAVTTRIFLGTRIECAQCQDHPFDEWKQTDFYKMAAFTTGNTDPKILDRFEFPAAMSAHKELAVADREKQLNVKLSAYYHVAGQCLESTEIHLAAREIKLPHDFKETDGRPHDVVSPAPLFGSIPELPDVEDRAERFARWVTSPSNPRFTRVIVNQLWKKLFGAPLTAVFDGLTGASKSSMPELERYLETLMVERQYNMKAFLCALLNTRAYQSAAGREEYTPDSTPHFEGPFLLRMTPEQIWDSFVTLVSSEPDVKNSARAVNIQSRIRTAKTADDAYEAMGAARVFELTLARIEEDARFTEERALLLAEMEKAGRNGDQAGVQIPNKSVFSLEAQWEKSRTETLVLPNAGEPRKNKALRGCKALPG